MRMIRHEEEEIAPPFAEFMIAARCCTEGASQERSRDYDLARVSTKSNMEPRFTTHPTRGVVIQSVGVVAHAKSISTARANLKSLAYLIDGSNQRLGVKPLHLEATRQASCS